MKPREKLLKLLRAKERTTYGALTLGFELRATIERGGGA